MLPLLRTTCCLVPLRELPLPLTTCCIVRRLKSSNAVKKRKSPEGFKLSTHHAMNYFDFNYHQIFGRTGWRSIRDGLLAPKKHVAILNSFSTKFEEYRQRIEEEGTLSLIETIHEDWQEAIQQGRVEVPEMDSSGLPPAVTSTTPTYLEGIDDSGFLKMVGRSLMSKKDTAPTSQTNFSPDDEEAVQPSHLADTSRRVFEKDFQVTGLEAMSAGPLRTVGQDDSIQYPAGLTLMVYPKGVYKDFPSPVRDPRGLSGWWLVDGASVVPVLALDLCESDSVLDMCAAPGGKSLMIILTRKFGRLVSNDHKLNRLGELRMGLSHYVPPDCEEAKRVVLKRKDASMVHTWDEFDLYDKVLLDAPCLTDRLSANQEEGNIFDPEFRSIRLGLPHTQTRMLVNALRSVKVGGCVVYSTCTLTPAQNEQVVENAVALAGTYYGIECVERSLEMLRKQLAVTGLYRFSPQCRRGITVIPWEPSNFGPMYVAKLERIK